MNANKRGGPSRKNELQGDATGLLTLRSAGRISPSGWSLLPGAPALTRTGLAPARTTRLSGRTLFSGSHARGGPLGGLAPMWLRWKGENERRARTGWRVVGQFGKCTDITNHLLPHVSDLYPERAAGTIVTGTLGKSRPSAILLTEN